MVNIKDLFQCRGKWMSWHWCVPRTRSTGIWPFQTTGFPVVFRLPWFLRAAQPQTVAHPRARPCSAPVVPPHFTPPQAQDVVWNGLKHHLLIITYYVRCPVLI